MADVTGWSSAITVKKTEMAKLVRVVNVIEPGIVPYYHLPVEGADMHPLMARVRGLSFFLII